MSSSRQIPTPGASTRRALILVAVALNKPPTMVQLLLPATMLALAVVQVAAGPIPVPPTTESKAPPADVEVSFVDAPRKSLGRVPAADTPCSYQQPQFAPPHGQEPHNLVQTPAQSEQQAQPSAQLPAELLAFNPSSQYTSQELRRQRRISAEKPFEHSPYGSGALPVPAESAETGFGARTLF